MNRGAGPDRPVGKFFISLIKQENPETGEQSANSSNALIFHPVRHYAQRLFTEISTDSVGKWKSLNSHKHLVPATEETRRINAANLLSTINSPALCWCDPSIAFIWYRIDRMLRIDRVFLGRGSRLKPDKNPVNPDKSRLVL